MERSPADVTPGRPSSRPAATGHVLLARGFRPFFLLCALFGCALPPAWLAIFGGWLPPPGWLTPVGWHAHEMIFGFTVSAIAGFLLTSVPVWTQTAAVTGARLAALVALWLLGRLAMLAAGRLPPAAVAAADLLLLPALLLAVAPPILRSGQRRNFGFPLVLAALFAANLLVHAQAVGVALRPGGADLGVRLGVHLVTLLIVVIGGRIVPAFTANALRRAGREPGVRTGSWLERLVVPAFLVFAGLDLWGRSPLSTGIAGLGVAALLALRLAGWQGVRTLRDPLVWSLHVGYAWVPVGVALLALSALGADLPRSTGLHALTAGAMGAMILAVASRVPLGHTGRPLAAPPPVAAAYLMVSLGALLRIAGPLVWPAHALSVLLLSAGLWSGAFAVYAIVYAPILTSPRVDGLPG
jgi:uncharacterized protein involved in response to NO